MYWNFYFDLRVYVCFCVSMYTEYRSLLRPEVSSVGFIGAAIIGSCELLNMDAGGWNLLCQKEQPFPLSLPIFLLSILSFRDTGQSSAPSALGFSQFLWSYPCSSTWILTNNMFSFLSLLHLLLWAAAKIYSLPILFLFSQTLIKLCSNFLPSLFLYCFINKTKNTKKGSPVSSVTYSTQFSTSQSFKQQTGEL